MITKPILLTATLLLAIFAMIPTANAEPPGDPCSGNVDTECGGYYTWCSHNQGTEPGYRSPDGTCAPGYSAQLWYDQECYLWVDIDELFPMCIN